MGEKIPMEGVNVSPKMVCVRLNHACRGGNLTTGFFHPLSQERINLNLIIAEEGDEGARVLCCAAAAEGNRIGRLISAGPDLPKGAEVHEPAGLISMFPLRSSLKTVGLALIALAEARVSVHGFCSSLSALTFVIDHDRLDEALAAFEGCFGFPGERLSKG
jgi:aspartokinase